MATTGVVGPPLGERLRVVRVVFDRAQGDVARRVGISGALLSQYESGGKRPSKDRAFQILRAILDDQPQVDGRSR